MFDCQDELVSLLDSLVDVIFCAKDLDGRYVEVNSAFVRRTGRASKRQVIGTCAADHFHEELASRYSEQDAAVFATGRPLRDELELIRRPDGSRGWYVTTKIPVIDHSGSDEVITGLVSVSRDLVAPPESELHDLRLVIQYVHTNVAHTMRVAELAALVDLTTRQLSRRMKQVFGLTPIQFVQRVRIDKAAHLLAHTDQPIARVGATCGFYDQAEFTRRFAQFTNATPAQFRIASIA